MPSTNQPPAATTNGNDAGVFNPKSKAVWTFAFIAISVLSIWAVVSHTKDFSLAALLAFVRHADPFWVTAALFSMIGFIVFEGMALLTLCHSFGYHKRLGRGNLYSAADIYFSAITPSATGGQPASAFFMIKDGIPGTLVTVTLLANLIMYTAAIVILGLCSLFFHPSLLSNFSPLSRALISFGMLFLLLLLCFFILLVYKKGLMRSLCRAAVKIGAKLHLVRNREHTLLKLDSKMESYSQHTAMLSGKGKMLTLVFIFNLLQRICQIAVTPFTYLAGGGSFSEAVRVFFTQTDVTLGAHCIPIPGAMGVTDYLMIDGFEELNIANPAILELLSRSLSFYICIIICGLTVLGGCYALSKRDKRRNEK